MHIQNPHLQHARSHEREMNDLRMRTILSEGDLSPKIFATIRLRDLEDQVRRLKQENGTLTGDLCSQTARVRDLENQVKHFEDQNRQLAEDLETVRQQHSMSSKPQDPLVHELQREVERLKGELDTLYENSTTLKETGVAQDCDITEEARLSAHVVDIKQQLADIKVAYEAERKTDKDQIIQLSLKLLDMHERFGSISTPPQDHTVGSKRSTPSTSSSTSAPKRRKSVASDFQEIDQPAEFQVISNAKVRGLAANSAELLPSAVSTKIESWIQKLDARGKDGDKFIWLKPNAKTARNCAIQRLKHEKFTWTDEDNACMDCERKMRPCIVIREGGPILLSLRDCCRKGNPSDATYWIKKPYTPSKH